MSFSRRDVFGQQINDPVERVRDMFSHVIVFYPMHLELLQQLDDTIDGLALLPLSSLFLQHLHKFNVYVSYADNYIITAATRELLCQAYPPLHHLIKQKLDEVNALYQRHDNTAHSHRDFSLKALLIEPIKQIARYVNVLRVLSETSPEKEKRDYTLVLQYMSGLLERTCKNFNLLEPHEVLKCTLDEFGRPYIGGGSVELLIERLTHRQFIDPEFTNAFLLTYRMFMTPREFLDMLQRRYASTLDSSHNDNDKDKGDAKLVQQQVIRVFKQWVESRLSSYDFEDKNSELVRNALHWIENVLTKDEQHRRYAEQLRLRLKGNASVKVIQLGSISNPTTTSSTSTTTAAAATSTLLPPTSSFSSPSSSPPSPPTFTPSTTASTSNSSLQSGSFSKKKGRQSVSRSPAATLMNTATLNTPLSGSNTDTAALNTSITEFAAELIAREITLEDFDIYRRIMPREFLGKAWSGAEATTRAPHLTALCTRFNHLSLWVVYEITRPETSKERASVLAHIVAIATELLNLHNFHSLVALVSGLNNIAVTRLTKTLNVRGIRTIGDRDKDGEREREGGREGTDHYILRFEKQ
jgi:hypothetical protein